MPTMSARDIKFIRIYNAYFSVLYGSNDAWFLLPPDRNDDKILCPPLARVVRVSRSMGTRSMDTYLHRSDSCQ